MDAGTDWWDPVVALCREVVPRAEGRLAGVAVSGIGPCVLPTDSAGAPLAPAILYGIDSRATDEVAELEERLGRGSILERCGTELGSQAAGAKLLWLRNRRPEIWRQTSMWFSCHSWIGFRLTGEWYLDHHTASQFDPLYDIRSQDWLREWCDEILPDARLPRLVWPADIVGTVTVRAARETTLPVGLPVIAGTVDAWAEAFSAGVRRPGDLMVMYGSTMFMVQVLPAPVSHPGLWTTSGVERESHTLAAGMSTSGSLTAWVRDLTSGADFPTLIEEAEATTPGSDGLLMLPYFAGERSPIHDPNARGTIIGLTLDHNRGHLFRAAYEGIGYAIRQVLDQVAQFVGPAARVVAVGGGTQGGLWTQIVSDIAGVEQIIPRVTIGASYGDALLAAIGTGSVPPATDWATEESIVRPRPENRASYDALYELFTSLYPKTVDVMHELARLQSEGGLARGAEPGPADPVSGRPSAPASAPPPRHRPHR